MAGIPEATPIVLTADEQAELEELTRSTKTEYRLRQRAQIVLLAAKGVASRAIGRKVGCTPERRRSGGCAMRATVLPGWTRPATAAPSPNTRPRPTNGFLRCSTGQCRRDTDAGPVR